MDDPSDMNTNKKEITVKKHSAIVQMSNKVTAQQRKAFNALIYIARSILKEKPGTYEFHIDLATLKKLSGIESTNNTQLKQALDGLVHTVIKFNILGKDIKEIWGAFALLAGATINNGIVEFGFAPQIHKTLLNPRIYTALDLNVIKGLDSKYSIALYKLARDYINVQIPEMSIETFRELMGIEEDQYKNSANLKRKVIDPAVSEVSEKTEINVAYDLLRRGKKVTAIKLHTRENNLLEHEDRKEKELEDLIILLPPELMKQESVKKQLKKFLELKGYDYVRSNITYTLRSAKTNLTFYLQKALENDWAEEQRLKEAARKCQEEKNVQNLKEEKERLRQEKQLACQVKEYMNSLTEEELSSLKKEAIDCLDEETLRNAKVFKTFEILIDLQMKEIVANKFKAAQ
ncbi:MAG TPA: RepB family plasmid replication initiator protein [Thermodesulfovibrionales bacterium]|nr:RepB family plasmid replication initiator protein [Thermodesulfovibrionales bacterium]